MCQGAATNGAVGRFDILSPLFAAHFLKKKLQILTEACCFFLKKAKNREKEHFSHDAIWTHEYS
jgi:hypothetical protein